MIDFALALLVFLLLWLLVLFIRGRLRRVDVRGTDLLIALIPIAFYVLFTGKLKELVAVDQGTHSAVQYATQARVEAAGITAPRFDQQVPFKPRDALEEAAALNALVESHPDGLTFKFGEFYNGRVIQQAVTRLLAQPQFHYLVVVNDEDRFIALGNARTMLVDFDAFADKVLRQDRIYFAARGFLLGAQVITTTDTHVEALAKMAELKEETAPVVDTRGFFMGVKSRAQLVAEVVVDLAQALKPS